MLHHQNASRGHVRVRRKKNLMDGLNMDDLCDRKIEEDKTNSMLRLDLNKILKLFIGDENM